MHPSRPAGWLAWVSAGYAYFFMDTRGQESAWGSGGDTPDARGAEIEVYRSMHTRAVVGITGSITSPGSPVNSEANPALSTRAYDRPMTEKQPYELVRSEGEIELRRYPEHVVVETEVSAGFEDAGNRAFRYLFGYISGENTARQSIDMTSPVVQSRSQRVAMTAPVVQTGSGHDYTVAFVLPASFTRESAPLPARAEVELRTVPARLVAATSFSGRWSEAAFQKHRTELLSGVRDAGFTAVGDAWFARFDPPYTPWFLRHNEVLVEVADQIVR
ncbi:MAG: heme-binding protein [Microbacteriaceae bacterium]